MANNIMVRPGAAPQVASSTQTAPEGEISKLENEIQTLTADLADQFKAKGSSTTGTALMPPASGRPHTFVVPPHKDPIAASVPLNPNGTPRDPNAPPMAPGEVTPTDPGGPPVLKKIGHVWVIMMENQDWSAVKGSADAPYINNVLLKQGAHAENYVASTHPSEPNYLELEAGSTLGVTNDGDPRTNHQSTHDHLTRYMTNAGVSWKEYAEDIGGSSVPLDPTGKYMPKHNPMVYFDDNTGNGNANDPFGIAHNRPYTEMAGDLSNGTEPQYSFITPNMVDDGHDPGAPLNNRVKQQDAWLQSEIPKIMASKDYQKDGCIMVVWDEGRSGAHNPSGMIALSPFAKPGYSNNISYSHASTLRTVQEIFGVGPFLGDAANATDLSDLFQDPTPPAGPTPNPTPTPSAAQ